MPAKPDPAFEQHIGAVRHFSRFYTREIGALVRSGFNYPKPEQGLIVFKRHYVSLGGHAADAAKPESELLRRLGRARIVRLRSSAVMTAPLQRA